MKDPLGGEKRKEKEEMSSEPRRKKMRQMIIGENMQNEMPRYEEFGEKPRWEIFDWEGKMKAYEKDLI